jgi:hypothetical protein
MSTPRAQLRQFADSCCKHLNEAQVQTSIGRHKLRLSTRTLSDIVEKLSIDHMIEFFGQENVSFKNWNGYDVILAVPDKIYVNIKTNEYNRDLEGTWVFSASVGTKLKAQGILEHLYCVKFEYDKPGGEIMRFRNGKVAGPLAGLSLVTHPDPAGMPTTLRIRTEYNGVHCHVLERDYE